MFKIIGGIIGGVAAAAGIAAFSYQLGKDKVEVVAQDKNSMCKGISITQPKHDAAIDQLLTKAESGQQVLAVEGIAKDIPDGYVPELVAQDYGFPSNIYPEDIQINESKDTWTGNIYFGQDSDKQVTISFLLLGTDGQILHNYHRKVAKETGKWVAFPRLTKDTVTCDQVTVRVQQ